MTNCIVIAPLPPTQTASSLYTVRAGDTLVAIAKRFGFASWREIYDHPDNEPFRRKRPNPDRIFPGDVLLIPGRAAEPSLFPPEGANCVPVPPAPSAHSLVSARPRRGGTSANDPLATNYVQPGNLKIRLALFWVTNCYGLDSCSEPVLAKAEQLFLQHGLGMDIYPSRSRTAAHTIDTPPNVVASGNLLINSPPAYNHFNETRLEVSRRFDDQKTSDRRQRLPIIFCEFADPAKGITVVGSPWLPYVLMSGNLAADRATLAHEIIHAAGCGEHIPRFENVMAESGAGRTEIYRRHVEAVAKAYFTR